MEKNFENFFFWGGEVKKVVENFDEGDVLEVMLKKRKKILRRKWLIVLNIVDWWNRMKFEEWLLDWVKWRLLLRLVMFFL